MADRDVTVRITADDDTGRGVRSAERNFDGLDRRVKRSSRDRNVQLAKDAKKGVTVFESLFGGLVTEGKKAGILAGGASIEGFSDAFKALPPEVKIGLAASLAGAAALAAPVVAATVNAAVLAGVGGGGLAAGIILAAKDPAVAGAYTALGQRVEKRLEDSAKPFRSELIATAGIFGDAFDRQASRIDRIFAGLAPTIQPLAQGIAKAVDAVMPSVERAVQASLPIIRELAAELPTVGRLIGDLLDAIADGGPGAALVFKVILGNIEAIIASLTLFIRTMGGAANGVAVLDAKAHELAAVLTGHEVQAYGVQLQRTGASASSAATSFTGAATAAYNTAQAAEAANNAFRTLFGELMSVDQANLAVKTGMATLTQTIKGNAKTLDENTAAGRANVGAILSQVQALDQKRQADIDAGNGTKEATDKANAAYAANVQALRRVLIQLGLTAAEVDVLIGKYEAIPRNISTTITTTYRTNGVPQQGHSRYPTGTGGFDSADGWRPAQFAEQHRGGGGFAATGAGAGGGRTMPPTQVRSNVDVAVLLDGEPVRRVAVKVAADGDKRRDWRERAGRRG